MSFDGERYDAIVPRWCCKVDFTTAMLCCCSQFLVSVVNNPSLCMNNCLHPNYIIESISSVDLYQIKYLCPVACDIG